MWCAASGVWAVEANTETEISFDAKGMNELDSLLAPRLPDYQPRHRVIGVFAWLGKDYALSLSGVRHAPAAVLTSVVDPLDARHRRLDERRRSATRRRSSSARPARSISTCSCRKSRACFR